MFAERRGEQLIYGDFSKLFEIKIYGNIAEAGLLFGKLKDLDRSLLTGFISFILARVGYYSRTIFEVSGHRTIDNDDEDWMDDIELLVMAWAEELNEMRKTIGELADTPLLREHLTWSHYFENANDGKLLKLIFVSRAHPDWIISRNTHGDWLIAGGVDPSCQNCVVVHPATYKEVKKLKPEKFAEVKEVLDKENVLLLSTDEFAGRFIPNTEKKNIVLENWIVLRNKVLDTLHKEWPILVYALKTKQLSNIDEQINLARREYEENRFEHSIRDAGLACEALLSILYYRDKGKEPDRLTFDELLYSTKDLIEQEFGLLVHSDLEFVREWRNRVSHPQKEEVTLDRKTALQVIRRSEMFHELFKATFKPFQL
jgi:HEPN domain-containing protein